MICWEDRGATNAAACRPRAIVNAGIAWQKNFMVCTYSQALEKESFPRVDVSCRSLPQFRKKHALSVLGTPQSRPKTQTQLARHLSLATSLARGKLMSPVMSTRCFGCALIAAATVAVSSVSGFVLPVASPSPAQGSFTHQHEGSRYLPVASSQPNRRPTRG